MLQAYLDAGFALLPLYGVTQSEPDAPLFCRCVKSNCNSPGKHPLTPNGCKDASTDPEQIERWQKQFTNCNWGIATGTISGISVVDIDSLQGIGEWNLICQNLGLEDLKVGAITRTAFAETGRGCPIHLQ